MVFTGVDVALIICYALVFLFGTIGNCFVVRWFGNQKERQKAGNKLVTALAVNDFLSSIVVPLWQIHHIFRDSLQPKHAWYIGRGLCYSLPGLGMIFLHVTSFLLVAISLERYR